MKKVFSLGALLFCAIINGNAQDKGNSALFNKGDKIVSGAIGLGGAFGIPIQLGAEFGVTDNIGAGAVVGYGRRSYSGFGYDYGVNNILIGVRGNYHLPLIDKIDTYGGLTAGYNVASVTGNSALVTASYGGVFIAGHLGGRYYVTKPLSIQAELGYGIAYLTVGVAYKL
jgi:hypothetical protein